MNNPDIQLCFQSDEIAIHPELKLKYIPIGVFIKKVFDQLEKEILYQHIDEQLKNTAAVLLDRWIFESKERGCQLSSMTLKVAV